MSESADTAGVGQAPTQRESMPTTNTAQNTASGNSSNVTTDTPRVNTGAGPSLGAGPTIAYPEGASKTARRNMRRKALHNQRRNLNDVLSSGGTNQSPQNDVGTGHTNTPHEGRSNGGPPVSVQERLHINRPPNDQRSSKRQRAQELNSSETRSKPKRRDAKGTPEVRPGTSFANAVVDSFLVMAIINQPAEGLMIPCSRDDYALIFSALNELIFEDLAGGEQNLPIFNQTHLKQGAIRIVCANSDARRWLEVNIQRLRNRTKMNLAVGEFDLIPRPAVFLAFFAFTKESSDKLLFMLKRYNPAIANVIFSVARRKETPTGTHLQVRVSQADAAIIRANNGVFRFCMGESHFREFPLKSRARAGGSVVETDEVDDDMETISES